MGEKPLGLTIIVGSYLVTMHLGGTKMPSKKGEVKKDESLRMLTPTQVWHRVIDLPKVIEICLPPPNVH